MLMDSAKHGVASLGSAVMLTAATVWLPSPCWSKSKDHTSREVAAVAARVAQHAKRTEQREGKHDLIQDAVRTKTTATGEKIIEQVGEASFYGKGFHGKKTASGTTFSQHGLTAAHPTLPLGTRAKVTNLENGKAVRVRITDRGPHAKGRNIDLSRAAAQKIGLTPQRGEAPVKIEAAVPPAGEPVTAVGKADTQHTGRTKKSQRRATHAKGGASKKRKTN
jgi:rare lipoprotein A (peptidoglycan hydrolase)